MFEALLPSQQLYSHVRRLTVHPILGYQGEKGGGSNVLSCVIEGENIHHYAFVEGAIILPCQLLWGQMSTHAIFHRGQMSGWGGGGKCPAPVFSSAFEFEQSRRHFQDKHIQYINAANFEKVEGAFCIGLVHPPVLPFVRLCVRYKN